jgi:hypothetical protein
MGRLSSDLRREGWGTMKLGTERFAALLSSRGERAGRERGKDV